MHLYLQLFGKGLKKRCQQLAVLLYIVIVYRLCLASWCYRPTLHPIAASLQLSGLVGRVVCSSKVGRECINTCPRIYSSIYTQAAPIMPSRCGLLLPTAARAIRNAAFHRKSGHRTDATTMKKAVFIATLQNLHTNRRWIMRISPTCIHSL